MKERTKINFYTHKMLIFYHQIHLFVCNQNAAPNVLQTAITLDVCATVHYL